jgi:hypothetical protein
VFVAKDNQVKLADGINDLRWEQAPVAFEEPQTTAHGRTERRVQEAVTSALADPGRAHPELEKYAKDKALSGIYQTLYFYEKNGIVGRGQPRIAPR